MQKLVALAIAVVAVASNSHPFDGHRYEGDVSIRSERSELERVDPDVRSPRKLAQAGAVGGATQNERVPRPLSGQPREHRMTRGTPFTGDLRALPQAPVRRRERPEREGPTPAPELVPDSGAAPSTTAPVPPTIGAPAPAPAISFDGLDYATWGAGHPPDTNGDVGPVYYIQTINTSIGIFNKTTGALVSGVTFDSFMGGHFGNVCDTDNFGDPVVLYDTFEDRWVITDFAFQLSGNDVLPPALQCFAVSKTGDPVAGGWNFYSVETLGGLGDYPKLGIWPDGIYMAANMFDYSSAGSFQFPRVWAFNKQQMYAGAPAVQVVSFDGPVDEFTLLPGNARLQTGTPPVGTPNYFVSTWVYRNGLTVYKFHVDWDRTSLSTFTGPDTPATGSVWPDESVPNAATPANSLDVLQIRAMAQAQYTNIGGAESLWTTHTVRRASGGFAAPRWYQVNVTGGTVASPTLQTATWDPDGANLTYRYVPSLAVDRTGNMALGYSTSNSATNPGAKYAGRLAGDPANTFSQTEQTLIQGSGTQSGNCGGSTCTRWGDYSSMTLDPDGCRLWFTTEYYNVTGLNHLTRIGAFSYPSCAAVGSGGAVQGTVTSLATSNPVPGAIVALGSRTTTTNASGVYTFTNLPAGTYPVLTAGAAGYSSSTTNTVVVTDGGTTVRNFSLGSAPASGCFVDTTQSDFQTGAQTNCDLNGTPGDVTLNNAPILDQRNTTLGNFGAIISTTTYGGQTFTPSVTGQLLKADINLFCSQCSGTPPSLTLSVRATSGGLPIGADLATATIPGFSSGVPTYYQATFAGPPTLTGGTQYALVIRPTSNPASPGVYAHTRSGSQFSGANVYAGGTRLLGASSGTTWTIPMTGGTTTDTGFRTTIAAGYISPGTLTSAAKDANPVPGALPQWTTISWTATTTSATAVYFHVAGANNKYGPFNFVGPDGTGSTFFASGASLAQFNGLRYLKYQVSLITDSSTATPSINDVTICFNNVAFTDHPVEAGVTIVKAQHITEMRTRVDAQRTRFGLLPFSWTDSPLTGVQIRAVHVSELRTALGEAYTAHALIPPAYADPTLIEASTPINAQHINQLRAAIVALEGSP